MRPLPLTSGVSVTLGRSLHPSEPHVLALPLTSAHPKSLSSNPSGQAPSGSSAHSCPSGLPLADVHQVWGSALFSSPYTPHLGQLLAPRVSASTFVTSTPRTLSQSRSLLGRKQSIPSWAWPPLYFINRSNNLKLSQPEIITGPQKQLLWHPHHCELSTAPLPPSRQPSSRICFPLCPTPTSLSLPGSSLRRVLPR